MMETLLNDRADGDAVAMSVLMRYKPYEPEMVLQLFGSRFRQWHVSTEGGGKRDFIVPWPGKPEMPEEVALYMACAWRDDEMCLLQWLRKTNKECKIIRWLKQAHARLATRSPWSSLPASTARRVNRSSRRTATPGRTIDSMGNGSS